MLLLSYFLVSFLIAEIYSKRHRHIVKKSIECIDPPNMEDELATWMKESLNGDHFEEISLEELNTEKEENEICSKSPRDGLSIMERALCPWETRVNFEETREPKIIVESVCLCRKSRGSSGAFCMPIVRKVPILRRVSCDPKTHHWQYTRTFQMIVVGCHSVLPRTQRVTRLANF